MQNTQRNALTAWSPHRHSKLAVEICIATCIEPNKQTNKHTNKQTNINDCKPKTINWLTSTDHPIKLRFLSYSVCCCVLSLTTQNVKIEARVRHRHWHRHMYVCKQQRNALTIWAPHHDSICTVEIFIGGASSHGCTQPNKQTKQTSRCTLQQRNVTVEEPWQHILLHCANNMPVILQLLRFRRAQPSAFSSPSLSWLQWFSRPASHSSWQWTWSPWTSSTGPAWRSTNKQTNKQTNTEQKQTP